MWMDESAGDGGWFVYVRPSHSLFTSISTDLVTVSMAASKVHMSYLDRSSLSLLFSISHLFSI